MIHQTLHGMYLKIKILIISIVISLTMFGQTRTTGMINVLDYGLKGDSTTDNTTAFRNLIASLPKYGTNRIIFPTGQYRFTDSILITVPCIIEGSGAEALLPFYQTVDTPQRAAARLLFDNGSANFLVFSNTTYNKNNASAVINLAIKYQHTGNPSAGAAIKFINNIYNPLVNNVSIRGFYYGIDNYSSTFLTVKRCFIQPFWIGINQNNITVPDGGGLTVLNNTFMSGLDTINPPKYAIYIGSGGGIIISGNFFNAQYVFKSKSQFKYFIYSDFAGGVTSDVTITSNALENYRTSAIYMNNVNSSKCANILIGNNEIGPYNADSAGNAIRVSKFYNVSITGNIGIALGISVTYNYSFVRIDSSDRTFVGNIQQGWVTDDSAIACTRAYDVARSPVNQNYPLLFSDTLGTAKGVLSNAAAVGAQSPILFWTPHVSQSNSSGNFYLSPRGTGGTLNKSEIALFSTDYNADKTNYDGLVLNMTGVNADIGTLSGGTGTAVPIRMYAASGNVGQLTLNTNGSLSSNGNWAYTGATNTWTLSSNASYKLLITNSNSGASADASFEASNGTGLNFFGVRGTSETAYNSLAAGNTYIYSTTDFAHVCDGCLMKWATNTAGSSSAQTNMQLLKNGNWLLGKNTTDNSTARAQITDATQAQIALHYDATHYMTLNAQSAGGATFTISHASGLHLASAGATADLVFDNTGSGIYFNGGTGSHAGQTVLVSGTKTLTITNAAGSSLIFVQLVSPSGASSTVQYQGTCTTGSCTIQANLAAGTINTADGSTVNYLVVD